MSCNLMKRCGGSVKTTFYVINWRCASICLATFVGLFGHVGSVRAQLGTTNRTVGGTYRNLLLNQILIS
jgi:hypothetical protein